MVLFKTGLLWFVIFIILNEMSHSMLANTSVSEIYNKYLISVYFNGSQYYTLTGIDLSDNDIDKVLVNEERKLLLFSNFQLLLSSLLSNKSFSDVENIEAWKTAFKVPTKPYTSINISYLDSVNNVNVYKRSFLTGLVGAINFVANYAIQIKDRELTNLISHRQIDVVRDFFMDRYIWSNVKTCNPFYRLPLTKLKQVLQLISRNFSEKIEVLG